MKSNFVNYYIIYRQDLVGVLGEDNPFIQSFEPNYNRAGGIDTGRYFVTLYVI